MNVLWALTNQLVVATHWIPSKSVEKFTRVAQKFWFVVQQRLRVKVKFIQTSIKCGIERNRSVNVRVQAIVKMFFFNEIILGLSPLTLLHSHSLLQKLPVVFGFSLWMKEEGQFQSMHSWMNQAKHPVLLLYNTLECWPWPDLLFVVIQWLEHNC